MSPVENPSPFEIAVAEPSELGECPLWSEAEQAVYWIDIVAPALKRLDPTIGQVTTIAMPEQIGCIAFVRGGGFVAGFRSGIWLLDAHGQRTRFLARNPEDSTASRFNDGRVDARGRFWVGTKDDSNRGRAGLYCLEKTRLDRIDFGLTISNGVAFSPDEAWAYHADTPRRVIWRRALDRVTGAIGPRQPWLDIDRRPADPGCPDGAAVDAQGCYWVAIYEGGRIERYAPDGRLLEQRAVPVVCPTMVCLGGHDLRTLYVTSARHERPADELARWPLSGCVLATRVDTPGQSEHLFQV